MLQRCSGSGCFNLGVSGQPRKQGNSVAETSSSVGSRFLLSMRVMVTVLVLAVVREHAVECWWVPLRLQRCARLNHNGDLIGRKLVPILKLRRYPHISFLAMRGRPSAEEQAIFNHNPPRPQVPNKVKTSRGFRLLSMIDSRGLSSPGNGMVDVRVLSKKPQFELNLNFATGRDVAYRPPI